MASRILRLLEAPRRRVAILRRVVWPYRLIGGLFQAAPWLGDFALRTMARHLKRTTPDVAGMSGRTPHDARPTR